MKNGTKNNLSRALIQFYSGSNPGCRWIFRFLNVNWDESYHLHPDERYLSMVLNNIQPVESVGDILTHKIQLKPNTHGYTFCLWHIPLFIIRYVGELIGQVVMTR